MAVFLKKWFGASGVGRVTLCLLYLFITITIPLYHTCCLASSSRGTCCHFKSNLDEQSDISLQHEDCDAAGVSNYGQCLACMYSTTSNSTEVFPAAITIDNEVLTFFPFLPSSGMVKQSEWLSCPSLRAPPVSIS